MPLRWLTTVILYYAADWTKLTNWLSRLRFMALSRFPLYLIWVWETLWCPSKSHRICFKKHTRICTNHHMASVFSRH